MRGDDGEGNMALEVWRNNVLQRNLLLCMDLDLKSGARTVDELPASQSFLL